MKKISLCLILFFTLTFSNTVFAQNKTKNLVKLPVFMAGDNEIVDQTIDGDLMIAGNQVKINADINGDLYAAAAAKIEINAKINGNLIILGNNVVISGNVAKNLIGAASKFEINSPAEISGYTLIGAESAELLGHFAGPVKVGANTLITGDKSVFAGNLEADLVKSELSPASKIIGEKKITLHEIQKSDPKPVIKSSSKFFLVKDVLLFLSKLLVLTIFVKLFASKIISPDFSKTFWFRLGIGFAILFLLPILSLILMITLIGIPLSLILILLYFIFIYLSGIVVSFELGKFISLKTKINNYYLSSFLALIALTLLSQLPLVSPFLKFFILIFGLGTIFFYLQNWLKK